jgi:hypothetical protein
VTHDFHPRSVEIILDNAQVYQAKEPLPFVPVGFALAYRDYAKFFFWPILVALGLVLLTISFSQALPGRWQSGVQAAMLASILFIYVLTLRSPVHVPVNNWHVINHFAAGFGVAVTGTVLLEGIDLLPLIVLFAIPMVTGVVLWVASHVVRFTTLPLRAVATAWRRLGGRWSESAPKELEAALPLGERSLDRYEDHAELFFRYPGTNEALNRADRAVHWSAYARILHQAGDAYPRTFYARVVAPDEDGVIAVQYWFCYYYDDWANEHQGDWEMAVVFIKDGSPIGVAASAHEAGERRSWAEVESRGDHVVLYVAAGSHALYFEPGAHVTTRSVAGLTFSAVDAALIGAKELDYMDVTPVSWTEGEVVDDARIVVIPEPDAETGLWGQGDGGRSLRWLNYPGRWGAQALGGGGSSAPKGPVYAGLRWDDPRMWAELVCQQGRRQQLSPWA